MTGWLQQGCHAGMTGSEMYAEQDLFSIYVHRSPSAPGAPQDSIFYGRDIDDRCAFRPCHLASACVLASLLAEVRHGEVTTVCLVRG